MGTKNDPLERPLLERERDARARDRTKRFLVDFEARWPTAAGDDRHRTAYAAAALSEDEQQQALSKIGPFLAYLDRIRRKTIPAGWRYLEQKSWTLLDQPEAKAATAPNSHPVDSPAGKAIAALFAVAGLSQLLKATRLRHVGGKGVIFHRMEITPKLLALAALPLRDGAVDREGWPKLTRQQAAAWDSWLREAFANVPARAPLREGAIAPWPWPPGVDGKVYADTGPPVQPAMSEHDAAEFR